MSGPVPGSLTTARPSGRTSTPFGRRSATGAASSRMVLRGRPPGSLQLEDEAGEPGAREDEDPMTTVTW